MYTFMEGVHFLCTPSISQYCMLHFFTSFDTRNFTQFSGLWYLRHADHSFYVAVSHILKFHYLNSTTIFLNALLSNFTIYFFTIVFISQWVWCSCTCGFNVCYYYRKQRKICWAKFLHFSWFSGVPRKCFREYTLQCKQPIIDRYLKPTSKNSVYQIDYCHIQELVIVYCSIVLLYCT